MDISRLLDFKIVMQVIDECRMNGKFINENSTDSRINSAYGFISQHRQTVSDYFRVMGYYLIQDSGFYYFVKDEYETIPKPYINNYIDYIDIYRFLKMLNIEISSQNGCDHFASSMETRLNKDVELQAMIEKMTFIKKKSTHREAIDSIIKRLVDDGFAEKREKDGVFVIMRSFKHIENAIEEVMYEL